MRGSWYGLRFFMLVVAVFLAGITETTAQTGVRPQGSRTKAQKPSGEVAVSNVAEIAATKADIEKMKVLLNQMQVNLGFVQTSQTPLKHQFELQTEMWGVLIKGMERHLDAMEKQSRFGSQEPGVSGR